MKPDLVWLRRDSGDEWRKVIVDVKVTLTDELIKAFKENDENIEFGPQEKLGKRMWARL